MRTLPYLLIGFIALIVIYSWLPAYTAHADVNNPSSPFGNEIIRVGVIPLEPFAFRQDSKPKGISIELWEEIAKVNGWKFEYTFLPKSGFGEIEPLLKKHKLDLVIGPIAISYKHINEISFSTPYYITTSNLITKDVPLSSFSPFLIHFFKTVYSLPIIILFLVVLICSFLIWHKERNHYPDNFPQSIYRGIPYSIWYGFHAILASDILLEAKDTYSRILTVIMLLCSVSLVTIGAASLTSALTISHMKIDSHINDLGNLKYQPVAIINGTDTQRYVHNLDFKVVLKDSLTDAIQSLNNGEVVAVIADKILVSDYLKENNIKDINITDIIVRTNIVAFALPKESRFRGSINDSIVHLQNTHWIYRMCLNYLTQANAAFCTM